jgi:hypothetical protein
VKHPVRSLRDLVCAVLLGSRHCARADMAERVELRSRSVARRMLDRSAERVLDACRDAQELSR